MLFVAKVSEEISFTFNLNVVTSLFMNIFYVLTQNRFIQLKFEALNHRLNSILNRFFTYSVKPEPTTTSE